MKNPVVSVVIPARNCSKLLGICLECVAAQTYPFEDFEVIVVDDGSTDDTADLAQSYSGKDGFNIRVVRRSVNEGPGAARNSGIEIARGEIIALLDADTEPSRDWLAEGVKSLEGFDVVEGKTVIGSPEQVTPFTHQTQNLAGGGFPTCNMFVRRDVFDRIGLFDTRFYDKSAKIHFREDTEIALRMLEKGMRLSFSEKALVTHRPLPGDWRRPLQLAKRYRHDRLLRQLHPDTYSEWTDVYFIKGRKFYRLRQKIYWWYLASLVGIPVSLILRIPYWAPITITAGSLLGIWWLHVRLMGKKALYSPSAWAALPVCMIVPLVFVGSIIAGVRLHPDSSVSGGQAKEGGAV